MRVRADRALIQDDWIERALREPIREHVIVLPDGETVHNAFFDRGFAYEDPLLR
jgi:hypothetical protein